jgi:sugar phosphate isomerase/epimerase
MRLNFTVYGSQFTYGWLPEGARLIGARDFVAEAVRRGFSGAEVPARTLEGLTRDELAAVRSLADAHGLELVVSAFGTDVDYLTGMVRAAEALGAGVLRTVVGGADYGGDRRAFAGGGWARFMDGVAERLGEVLRASARARVAVAVENHQDVASEDLLALCRGFDSEWFGVVLDAANPLATAEHPIEFARLLMPWIKYVHLKDYQIHWSDEGYRLARCPVGSGVVPFDELLPLLRAHGRAGSASLELAALEARHVRVFADDWWPEYPARDARALAHTLAFVHQRARPRGEDWRTPFERGAAPAAVAAYEERELRESIPLCAALTGDEGPLRALGEVSAEGVG